MDNYRLLFTSVPEQRLNESKTDENGRTTPTSRDTSIVIIVPDEHPHTSKRQNSPAAAHTDESSLSSLPKIAESSTKTQEIVSINVYKFPLSRIHPHLSLSDDGVVYLVSVHQGLLFSESKKKLAFQSINAKNLSTLY